MALDGRDRPSPDTSESADTNGSVFFYRVSSLVFVGGGAWASHTPESHTPEPYSESYPLKNTKKELARTVAFVCDPWIAGSYRGFNFK